MISVIIPVFNKKEYIKRSINSVLSQSFKAFELIIIDDGSTDQSSSLIGEFDDSRLSYHYKENGGVSSARNYGIKISKFQYICFLDADDEWLPNHLEVVNSIILKHCECDVIATNYYLKLTHEKRLAHSFKSTYFIIEDYFKSSLRRWPLLTSDTVTINKKILKTVGLFDENISNGEDLDYWFRIAMQYQIIFVSIPTAIYHVEVNNRATNNIQVFNDIFINKLINNYVNHKANPFALNYIQEAYFREVKRFLKNGQNVLVRKKLCEYKYSLRLGLYFWKYYLLSFLPLRYFFNLITKYSQK